jgi:hypothetical protein
LQKFITVNNYNPVPGLIQKVQPHWKGEIMKILFPLHIRIGRVEK